MRIEATRNSVSSITLAAFCKDDIIKITIGGVGRMWKNRAVPYTAGGDRNGSSF